MLKLQPKMAPSSRSTIVSFLHREGLTQQLTCIMALSIQTCCLTLHGIQYSPMPPLYADVQCFSDCEVVGVGVSELQIEEQL